MLEKKKIIAHRGVYNNVSVYENSIDAVRIAVDKNYAVEIDVRLTKDEKIVVFHDANIKRLTGIDMNISESSYDDLNRQEVLHIPLFQEVLDIVGGKVPILIEIKNHKKIGKLETKLVSILDNYDGEYLIQSFNPVIVYWFKRNYPSILRGQLSCKYKNKKMFGPEKFFLSSMIFNVITKPHFISYKYDELSIKKIRKYQKEGISVFGWTIDNKTDFNKYVNIYDNLIVEKII